VSQKKKQVTERSIKETSKKHPYTVKMKTAPAATDAEIENQFLKN